MKRFDEYRKMTAEQILNKCMLSELCVVEINPDFRGNA